MLECPDIKSNKVLPRPFLLSNRALQGSPDTVFHVIYEISPRTHLVQPFNNIILKSRHNEPTTSAQVYHKLDYLNVLPLGIMFPANGSVFPHLNINRLQVERNEGTMYSIHKMAGSDFYCLSFKLFFLLKLLRFTYSVKYKIQSFFNQVQSLHRRITFVVT